MKLVSRRLPKVILRRKRDGRIVKVNRHEYTNDIVKWFEGFELVTETRGNATDQEMEFQIQQHAIEMDRRHKPEEQKKRGDAKRAQEFHNLGEVNTEPTEITMGGKSVWHDLGFEDADERAAESLAEIEARGSGKTLIPTTFANREHDFVEKAESQEVPEETPEIEIPKMRWFALRAKVAKKIGMESKGIRDKAHALDLLRVAGITDWSQVDE